MSYNEKIIHYCWFGNAEKGDLIKRCIQTWNNHLNDYKFIEWSNSDLSGIENSYVRQAYECKKWAFVSDYMRLYALYNYGGIYMDTDVEVRKNLDSFLELDFFSCFEFRPNQATCFPISAVMGAKKNNPIIKGLLDDYNDKVFVKSTGEMDLTPNTVTITKYLQKEFNVHPPYNHIEKLELGNNQIIYPSYYFCNDKNNLSYAIHHFNGSWKKKSWILFNSRHFQIMVAKNSYLRNLTDEETIVRFKFFRNRTLLLLRKHENRL